MHRIDRAALAGWIIGFCIVLLFWYGIGYILTKVFG